jgi:minichromosome maintenance protein 10
MISLEEVRRFDSLKGYSKVRLCSTPYLGLRIMNRLVSAGSMNTRFSDIRFIHFQEIRTAMMGDNIMGCWATVGVLTEKGNPKLSSTGKNFSLWKLGSLEEITISLFLFGDEYTRHWKEIAREYLINIQCQNTS